MFDRVYGVASCSFDDWYLEMSYGDVSGSNVCVASCSYNLNISTIGMSVSSLLNAILSSKKDKSCFVLYVFDAVVKQECLEIIDMLHRYAEVPFQIYGTKGVRRLKPLNTVWCFDFFKRNFTEGSSILFFDTDDILTGPAAIDNSSNKNLRLGTISTLARLDSGDLYLNKAAYSYGGRSMGYSYVDKIKPEAFLCDDGNSIITTTEDVSLSNFMDTVSIVETSEKSNEYLALVGVFATRHNYLVKERSYSTSEVNRYASVNSIFCQIRNMVNIDNQSGNMYVGPPRNLNKESQKVRELPKWLFKKNMAASFHLFRRTLQCCGVVMTVP